MNIGRRILIPASLIVALWFSAGCDGSSPFFDSVNLDPHPPVITSLQTFPAEIFNGESVFVTLAYFDSGGDIETLEGRDLDSGGILVPADPEEGEDSTSLFFPGTSGEVNLSLKVDVNQAGVHRYQVWLVDSKDSRSEPAFFEVTVNY